LLPSAFQDVIVAAILETALETAKILETANRKPISIPTIRVEDGI
jgi:hypothetical protein